MEQTKISSAEETADKLANMLQKSQQVTKPPPTLRLQQPKEKCLSHFSRQVNSFYGDFYLQNAETLKIVLTSQVDATIYELLLTKQSKKQHEELNFFETIEEIYQYLMENAPQSSSKSEKEEMISIDENGRISIKVISTIGKKERQRTIFLQTAKVMQNREAYLENVVKKIGKSVLELRKEIQVMKLKEEEAQRINTELLQKLKQYGSKLHFNIDKGDAHYSKFKEVDKKIIKAIDNTTYFSLFGNSPLPKNENSYFNIKLGSTLSKNIMVGIGSKFTKGIHNVYSHQDFIGLYLYGQCYVWENSNQRDLFLKAHPIGQGSIVTTNINLAQGFISWQICGVRVAYAVIPLQLKAKQLFPVVLMINVNDCIEIDP